MRKLMYPDLGTPERRLLDVLLAGAMHAHPEYIQEMGNRRMFALVSALRGLGWDVQMKLAPVLTHEFPGRSVAFFYIGEHTLAAASGEDVDD